MHLDAVSRGDVIAEYDDGQRIVADQSGYILLSFAEAKQGGEWFDLGQPAAGMARPA